MISFTEKLGEEAEESDLYLTHRTGEFNEDRNNSRPIIAKFARYMYVTKCLKIRKKLKGKGYSILGRFKTLKMKKFTEALNIFGFTKV